MYDFFKKKIQILKIYIFLKMYILKDSEPIDILISIKLKY